MINELVDSGLKRLKVLIFKENADGTESKLEKKIALSSKRETKKSKITFIL